MVDTVIPPDRTTRLDMSGTDTLTVSAGGVFSVATSAQTVRFNGPTSNATITNAGTIENTAAGGRTIRVEASVGASFTAGITNQTSGIIQSQDDAVQIQAGSVTGGSFAITNNGSITSAAGQALDLAGGTGNFVANIGNTGTLGAAINDAVRLGGTSNTLNNSGTINGGTAAAYAVGADGVQFDVVGSGGTVTNLAGGAISGDRHGINATAGTNVTVDNALGATITGRNGSGVGLDGNGTVTNRGTITGAFSNSAGSDINGSTVGAPNGGGPDGINDGDGDGIDIDGQATIDNFGTIEGTGAGGTGSDGRANTSEGIAAGGGSITNQTGGIIRGLGLGILIDDSATGPAPFATTITNSGSITGTNSIAIRLIGAQNDVVDNRATISGGAGVAIQLGDGDDRLILRNGSTITGTSDGQGGTDTLDYTLRTGTVGVTVNLATGAATGTGGVASFEVVLGGSQNDTITGSAAADSLSGGGGDDTIAGGAGGDTLAGGTGFNLLSYEGDTQGVTVNLLAGTASGGHAQGDSVSGFNDIQGGAGHDGLTGDDSANFIFGGEGNDLLSGLSGSDLLSGEGGDDTILGGVSPDLLGGGGGFDLVDYRTSPEAVIVNLSLEFGGGGDAAGDTLLGFEAVYGSEIGLDLLVGNNLANLLAGFAGADQLLGQDGNDTLDGGAGADQMAGGLGDDLYTIENSGDAVLETADQGTDTVLVLIDTYTGGEHVEVLELRGTASIGNGGLGSKTIIGNFSLDNSLTGGTGDDTLVGGEGNDALIGGAGNDTASYTRATGAVTVDLSVTGGQQTGGGGFDTLTGIESVWGGDFVDTLIGNAGDNTLTGGAGADILMGGGGRNTAGYETALAGLTVRLDFAQLNTGDAVGDAMSNISGLLGSRFADTLVGTAGSETLRGGAGNDAIIGRQGADVLSGGAGQDYFGFLTEDFQAGVYDIVTDFNTGGVLDWFCTRDIDRGTILAAAWDNGVVVTLPGVGLGLTGGGVFIQNITLNDFWGQLATF